MRESKRFLHIFDSVFAYHTNVALQLENLNAKFACEQIVKKVANTRIDRRIYLPLS